MQMIKSCILSFLPLLFCCLACNGQDKSKKASVAIEKTHSKNDILLSNIPRVDSILEFNSMILSIFEDSKGNFWFGSWCDGLCKYDPKTSFESGKKKFTYYTVESGIPYAEVINFNNREVPRGNAVSAIQEDQDGNILFMTLGGVVKFDGKMFTKVPVAEGSSLITDSFDYSEERWKEERNHLWFGDSQDDGAFRYDGEQLKHLTFPMTKNNQNARRYATYSLFKDRNANIWFGTEGAGIMRYDGKSFTCINEEAEKGIVRAFFQDKDGRVWISNVLMGLHYYDFIASQKGENPFVNFTKKMGYYTMNEVRNDASLDDARMLDGIQSIEQDAVGNLWFGTFSDGLWRYDGQNLTHYTTKNGLPNDAVKTIYKDKSGQLWFGIGRNPTNVYHFNGWSFDKFGG